LAGQLIVGRLNDRPRYTAALQAMIGGVMHLTSVFQKVAEGYVGFVEELPGANTQGATLDEARANLAEAVELILDANRTLSEETIQGQEVIREKMLLSTA
jgi:predicted RNase H-like HicB family nuclease